MFGDSALIIPPEPHSHCLSKSRVFENFIFFQSRPISDTMSESMCSYRVIIISARCSSQQPLRGTLPPRTVADLRTFPADDANSNFHEGENSEEAMRARSWDTRARPLRSGLPRNFSRRSATNETGITEKLQSRFAHLPTVG